MCLLLQRIAMPQQEKRAGKNRIREYEKHRVGEKTESPYRFRLTCHPDTGFDPSRSSSPQDWRAAFQKAAVSFAEAVAEKRQVITRIEALEKHVCSLSNQIGKLCDSQTLRVPIVSLAPWDLT